jgi:hypothetical protein
MHHRLHTFARLSLAGTFFGSCMLLFGEFLLGSATGLLAVVPAVAAASALLIMALREREERLTSLVMVTATLPLIGSALTGFTAYVESSGSSASGAVCMATVNGVWSTVPCSTGLALLSSALTALLTLQFAIPLLFLGLAVYVGRSSAGAVGLRRVATLGLLFSAGAAAYGVQDLGGFVVLLLTSPALAITGFLLVVWALSPITSPIGAPPAESVKPRALPVDKSKRGRVAVGVTAIAAAFSLLSIVGSGLALQGFPSNRPEVPMNNFLELVGAVSRNGDISVGDESGEGIVINGNMLADFNNPWAYRSGWPNGERTGSASTAIERLLLVEADEPCGFKGGCNVLAVFGLHPDPDIAIFFWLPPSLESSVTEKLNEAAAAYFATGEDPLIGEEARYNIQVLTAEGAYPVVYPEPIRIEGEEAEALVRQAHELLASTTYQTPFSALLFLPFLFVALIPLGALRWARAVLASQSSLAVVPGLVVPTATYGAISGVALLISAGAWGLVAGSADSFVPVSTWALNPPFAIAAASSLLAGLSTLVASVRDSRG